MIHAFNEDRPAQHPAPPAAVIFDFDLTLADSREAATACVAYALERLGFPPASREAVLDTIGLSLEATLERLVGPTDPEVRTRFRNLFTEHADQVMVDGTDLLEGVPEALTALRSLGFRLAIVSTKYRYRIEAILERHGLRGEFEVIVGGEDTSAQKPSPEGLERALSTLGLTPAEALYVGDHVVDAEAAMRAGVPFVAVLTGATEETAFRSFPHVGVLSAVSDLPALLTAPVS